MIAVIDYEVGNLGAIANMFRRIGVACSVTKDATEVARADRIVLPGNGAFDACMRGLRSSGLVPVIEQRVCGEGTPLLGICVGAQMLGRSSDEGIEPGLGWLAMEVRRFADHPSLRVPHMGWEHVTREQLAHPLTCHLADDARFYFTHSYCMHPDAASDVLLSSVYGVKFAAAVGQGHVMGVQFHPEKSHRYGRQLLAAFAGGA
jgi:glutamine amidotransferase